MCKVLCPVPEYILLYLDASFYYAGRSLFLSVTPSLLLDRFLCIDENARYCLYFCPFSPDATTISVGSKNGRRRVPFLADVLDAQMYYAAHLCLCIGCTNATYEQLQSLYQPTRGSLISSSLPGL